MSDFKRELLPDADSYHDGTGDPLTGPGAWGTKGCPFHGGSDSMRVNRDSGGWCCMACGEKGGDVLAFQMKLHGLDFLAAARELGALVEDENRYRGPTRAKRLPAADALELLYRDTCLIWSAGISLAHGLTTLTERDKQDLRDASRRVFLIAQESLR